MPCLSSNDFILVVPYYSRRLPTGRHSTARHGTARHGTARHGTARHGTARHGTARHGTARHGTARHGTARHGTARHGTARHGTARHGTARHGTARHGTARHGTARHGTARHGTELCWNRFNRNSRFPNWSPVDGSDFVVFLDFPKVGKMTRTAIWLPRESRSYSPCATHSREDRPARRTLPFFSIRRTDPP